MTALIIIACTVGPVALSFIIATIINFCVSIPKRKFYKILDKRPEMRKLWDELWLADKEYFKANADVGSIKREINSKCEFDYIKYLTAEDAKENEIDLEELRVMLKNYETIKNGAEFAQKLAREEFIYYCDEKGITIPKCFGLY